MKALIAIDGSTHSLRATQFLIRLMNQRGTMEAHVLNVQPGVPYLALLPDDRQADVERWMHEGGREVSKPACQMLSPAGVPYQLHVVSGDTAEAIVRCAREFHCDLIVMGTRGMGAVARLALGSVATQVIHLSDVPVTLVK
jgi:nucleotide-binding universal stress UspA family protein